MKEAFISS